MRNLKKLLAVIVAVCTIMAFSIPAFAADAAPAAPADSKICSDLGVLKGDTADGVTAAYLAKGTTRLQAAILQLRLLGKEAEAYAETATENFADADLVTWADGKALLAYLKKNPDLGWIGTDGKFDPNGPCTAQMFYKVLLESLGYKTGTDFQYADAIKFAGEKGLTKLAALSNLTNDNVATALVEALKAKTSDGKQTFAEKLVGLSIISGDAAATAGVYNPGNTTITVDSLKAVTYQRIDISLKDAIVKLDASKIAIKDLAISGATLSADGKKIIVKTAAQVAGTLYTITVAGTDYTFTGLQKDTGKPEVSTVTAMTNTVVAVAFKADDLDETTAVDPANYTIAGLTVTAAAFDSGDSKIVNLTTSAQTSGKLYELKVTKVTDKTGNVIDDVTKKFSGHAADTTKPTADLADASQGKGIKVTVTFTETGKLDEATALDINNYTINNDLKVLSAAFGKDGDGNSLNVLGAGSGGKAKISVILSTSNQVNGKLYTLTVKNIKDASGNVMDSKDLKFSGSKLDTTKIGQAKNPSAETNTSVRVFLNDEVDESTVVPANFTIDNSLTVSAVKVDKNENNASEIIVTTSSQVGGKLYTLTIANLKDKAGNGVDTDNDDKKFSGLAADTKKPEVKGVESVDQTTFKVYFSEKMDEASVETLANYSIDGGLGYPTAAEYKTDGASPSAWYVKLTTNNQASQLYTVTVKNVKDLSGNVIDSVDKKFSGVGDAAAKVAVDSIVAVDRSTIKITYNQAVSGVATTLSTYKIENTYETKTGDITTATNLSALGTPVDASSTSEVKATLGGDDKVVTLTFYSKQALADVYKLTILTSANFGKYGAAFDTDSDEIDFAGVADAKADITVDSVVALDKNTLELTFNSDVSVDGTTGLSATNTAFTLYDNADFSAGTSLGAATAKIDADHKNIVRLTFGTAMADNAVYYLNIATATDLTDPSGWFAIKTDDGADAAEVSFGTPTLDAPKLTVDYANMVDKNTVEVYFTKPISITLDAPADFDTLFSHTHITNVSVATPATVITGGDFVYAKVDGTKLTLFFTGKTIDTSLVPKISFDDTATEIKYAYYPTTTLATATADERDVEFGAVGTDNDAPYIVSAVAVGATKVKVTFSEGISELTPGDLASAFAVVYTADNKALAVSTPTFSRGDKEIVLTLSSGTDTFVKGTSYTVYLKSTPIIKDEAGIQDVKHAAASDQAEGVSFPGTY